MTDQVVEDLRQDQAILAKAVMRSTLAFPPEMTNELVRISSGTRRRPMGNWAMVVTGTGVPEDADRLFKAFVEDLKAKGHLVEYASFTSGSRHDEHQEPDNFMRWLIENHRIYGTYKEVK